MDMASKEVNSNLKLWNGLEKTDPKFTRNFSNGRFSGTDINPQWRWKKLTETFGPNGIGWGIEDFKTEQITLPNDEILLTITVYGWYLDPEEGEKCFTMPGFGSEYIFRQTKNGYHSDDEAWKKAMTEALGNAFKYVGLGADVFLGLYDDSKYVNNLRAAAEAAEQDQQQGTPPAAADKGEVEAPVSSPASDASISPADFVEQATGEATEGIVERVEGTIPAIAPQPDEESWGLAARVFDFTLESVESFEGLASALSINLKTLDTMKVEATGDYGQCMGALSNWVVRWLERDKAVKDEQSLTKKWATISKQVNGMKRTMPDFYVAITEGFKAKKAEILKGND